MLHTHTVLGIRVQNRLVDETHGLELVEKKSRLE